MGKFIIVILCVRDLLLCPLEFLPLRRKVTIETLNPLLKGQEFFVGDVPVDVEKLRYVSLSWSR